MSWRKSNSKMGFNFCFYLYFIFLFELEKRHKYSLHIKCTSPFCSVKNVLNLRILKRVGVNEYFKMIYPCYLWFQTLAHMHCIQKPHLFWLLDFIVNLCVVNVFSLLQKHKIKADKYFPRKSVENVNINIIKLNLMKKFGMGRK